MRVNYAQAIFYEEINDICEFMKSGKQIAYGEYAIKTEKKLSDFLGVNHTLLVNSGSSANMLAFMTLTSHQLGELRIKPGDEIITTACGFPTTISPIVNYGCIPVFVDVDETLNIDVTQIEKIVSDKTKAIMIAHTLGNPFNVEAVKKICDKYNLWLIEDNCLAAGTKIKTNNGYKNIEDIIIGDYVLTRNGFKKVLHVKMTGHKECITKFGITATPDHPFFTKKGIKRFDKLNASDIVYTWNEKLSNIEEKSIIDILTQNKVIGETILQDTQKEYHSLCIDKFGLIILEKFQKAIASIIKMKTLQIIKLKILNCFLNLNIIVCIHVSQKILKKFVKVLRLLKKKQKNGIEAKKARNGIKNMQGNHGKIKNNLSKFVQFAIKNIRHIFLKDQNFVPVHVKVNPKIVSVYNLLVQDEHEYFANNILVHNCDALGSKYNGQYTGTFGDLATSSFYPAHHITCGEGGAVYTNDKELYRIAQSMRDWGRDYKCDVCKPDCKNRFKDGYDCRYQYSHFGFNLKITELQAILLNRQIDKLPGFIEKRKQNWNILRQQLSKYFNEFQKQTEHSDPSWFTFYIADAERNKIVEYLERNGIGARVLFAGNILHHKCMEGVPYRSNGWLSMSDHVMTDGFFIGCAPHIGGKEIDYIIQVIDEYKN